MGAVAVVENYIDNQSMLSWLGWSKLFFAHFESDYMHDKRSAIDVGRM